jgi:lipopolysaccharide transport system permease protein
MLVFNNIAKISTDAVPPSLFYLSGIILWNYFSETFTNTADTFNQNQNIFGKVYFPRLVVPLSKLISGLIKFTIQFLLFLVFYVYFISKGYEFNLSQNIYLFPFLVVMVGFIGLGLGLIFTSLTIRYRDLRFLLQFGIQILMFCTPVIYPMSSISKSLDGDLIRNYMFYNPMSHIIECFRYLFLGKGEIMVGGLIYSFVFSLLIGVIGVYIFRRSEKTFIDNI